MSPGLPVFPVGLGSTLPSRHDAVQVYTLTLWYSTPSTCTHSLPQHVQYAAETAFMISFSRSLSVWSCPTICHSAQCVLFAPGCCFVLFINSSCLFPQAYPPPPTPSIKYFINSPLSSYRVCLGAMKKKAFHKNINANPISAHPPPPPRHQPAHGGAWMREGGTIN